MDKIQASQNQTEQHLNKTATATFDLREYLYCVRWTIVGIAAVAFLTHGSILFSQRFGIDTDIIMEGNHYFSVTGRSGLVWLAKLLGLSWFNLYLAQIFVLVFMTLFPVSVGYLFYHVSSQSKYLNLSLLVLGLSVVVSPFWAEQIYFLNQSPQVLLACVLIPVTILLVETARTNISHKWYCLILSFALMPVIFACYQAVIMVYITIVAAAFLLSFLKEDYPIKKGIQWIGFHAGTFCIGFTLYWIISALFYMEDSKYLTNQLSWGKINTIDVILNCLHSIKRSLTNTPPYYTGMYGVFCLLLAGTSLYIAFRKKIRNYILFLAAETFLMFAPYIFTFLYGAEVFPRMQLTMPMSQGCTLYLTIILWGGMKTADAGTDKRIPKLLNLRIVEKGIALILVVCLYRDTLSHLNYCTRFYYTDEWVYQYSVRIAEEIYLEIEDVRSQNGLDSSYNNILFLGSPDIPYNKTCLSGDVIGDSPFCWDLNSINRGRIFVFYRDIGYSFYTSYSNGAVAAFNAYFRDYFGDAVDLMPAYPAKGYVQYLKNDEIGLDYIVIKLGYRWRDLWPEEN